MVGFLRFVGECMHDTMLASVTLQALLHQQAYIICVGNL
jgi:hypothetical protein